RRFRVRTTASSGSGWRAATRRRRRCSIGWGWRSISRWRRTSSVGTSGGRFPPRSNPAAACSPLVRTPRWHFGGASILPRDGSLFVQTIECTAYGHRGARTESRRGLRILDRSSLARTPRWHFGGAAILPRAGSLVGHTTEWTAHRHRGD